MKKLVISIFLLSSIIHLSAENTPHEELILECAKGNTEACSTIINGNSRLSESAQKLEEQQWLEKEKLGISLLPLYLECKRGKRRSCTKFVKQVKRLELYQKK